MTDIAEMRQLRADLFAKIQTWWVQVRELQDANDGERVRLGETRSPESLGREHERLARIRTLRADIDDANDKLKVLDTHLFAHEADTAQASFLDAIAKLKAGSTLEAWAQLRDAALVLIRHRRIGMSAAAILAKIDRMTNPGRTVGVRVNDRLEDFDHLLARPAA
jgi:hypothetical protein